MNKRSPILNNMLREWVTKHDDFVLNAKGDITHEIIDGWIAAQSQKPFVIGSTLTEDERRIVTILCTRCADLHRLIMPIDVLSDGSKRVPAMCADRYKTEETYEYVDWGIQDHEKKVPVYEY